MKKWLQPNFRPLAFRPAYVAMALTALALSVAALLIALAYLVEQQKMLDHARQQYAMANQSAEQARREVALATSATQLLEQARNGGYTPDRWSEMRINIRQARLQRDSANKMLLQALRTPTRLFGSERFDISVSTSEESLFDQPPKPESELIVTLQGRALLRGDPEAKTP